jgi:hypothetical protein
LNPRKTGRGNKNLRKSFNKRILCFGNFPNSLFLSILIAGNARALLYSSTNKPILTLKVDQCYKSRSSYEMTDQQNEYQVYLSFEKTLAPASISSFAIKYNPSEAAT